VSFSVGAPSPPPPLPTGQDVDEGLRTATGVVRYLGHAGLVLVVGPALVLALLWPQRLSRRGPARVLWLGTGLVGAATLAGLWLYAPYTAGRTLSGVTVTDLREVLASTYGQAHLVRLGVLAAAVWLLRPLAAGRAGRGDLVLLGVLAVLGLGTWPVAGHPVASPLPAVSIAVTTVHLAAAAVWIGGLVVLAGFLLRRADERELGAILPIWSGWAAAAVTALLLTGLIQALIEVGTPDALLTATYGRLLLVKVALVAVVIGVAGYSRRLVRRRVAAARPGGVRRAVVLEAGLLAVVVAVAAALTQTTPARIEAAAGPGAVTGAVFSTTLESPLYSLQVSVEPAARGANAVHLYAFSPAGEPLPVVEWGAGVGLPDAGIEEVEVSLLPLTDNHATGEVVLPVAGEWQFRFTLRISEIDQASVSVVVPISEEF
jgi:copper transport protein